MLNRVLVAASLLVFAACGASTSRPSADSPAAAAAASPPASAPKAAEPAPPASTNPVEAVPLEVIVTDQTTTGRVMKLRAKVVNPHAQEVKGVRVQIVFLAPAGEDEPMKVLEIQQKEMTTTLEPGGADMLRWDVESLYLGSQGRFLLAAYPKTLGGKDLPPPDHWNE